MCKGLLTFLSHARMTCWLLTCLPGQGGEHFTESAGLEKPLRLSPAMSKQLLVSQSLALSPCVKGCRDRGCTPCAAEEILS